MTKLTCSEFDRLLIENVTGDGAVRERLRCHAESCPRCAAVWQEEQMLDAAILAWKCDPPKSISSTKSRAPASCRSQKWTALSFACATAQYLYTPI